MCGVMFWNHLIMRAALAHAHNRALRSVRRVSENPGVELVK